MDGAISTEGGGTELVRDASVVVVVLRRVVRLSAMRNSSSLDSSACAARNSITAGGTSAGRGSSTGNGVAAGSPKGEAFERVVGACVNAEVAVGTGVNAAGLLVDKGGAGGGTVAFGAGADFEAGEAGGGVMGVAVMFGGVNTEEVLAGADVALPSGAEKKDGTGAFAAAVLPPAAVSRASSDFNSLS